MAEIRETHTDVEVNGRTFRIRKFDALTGSFMLIKVTGLLAPLVKSVNLNKLKDAKELSDGLDAINIAGIAAELANLPEKDFNYIQEKCLKVCSEMLQAGPTPVLDEKGNFGVIGLEDDTMTVLALTVHALIFNVKSVFTGSPLASLLGGLSTTSPQG